MDAPHHAIHLLLDNCFSQQSKSQRLSVSKLFVRILSLWCPCELDVLQEVQQQMVGKQQILSSKLAELQVQNAELRQRFQRPQPV